MKKVSTIAALILAASLAITACGAPAAPNATPATAEAPPAPTEAAPAETPAPSQEAEEAKAPANPLIRISTTTSVNDSGLMSALQPAFEAETSYKLEITSNGTGAAIKLGESGDADCLLVHAKASEEEFVNNGFGVERIPFMYNFFVICGSEKDEAKVASAENAAAAFKAIADSKSKFVSRGDDSGTHKAELKIWDAAAVKPEGDWYISAGAGMGACLNQANELLAYIMTDKATFLSNKDNLELKLLLEKADELKNTYSVIAVSPDKNPSVNIEGANAFIAWLTGDNAKKIIAEYGVSQYGEALFYLI